MNLSKSQLFGMSLYRGRWRWR